MDEALRLESPFQKFHRTVAVDTVLGGVHLPAGAKVLVFLGAANRDPRKWGENADDFDLNRNASGHVAFGMGLHQCVGQPIARLEMEIVLQQLLQRVAPSSRTAAGADPAQRAPRVRVLTGANHGGVALMGTTLHP